MSAERRRRDTDTLRLRADLFCGIVDARARACSSSAEFQWSFVANLRHITYAKGCPSMFFVTCSIL